MTLEEMQTLFEKIEDADDWEYLEFDRVENKRSSRKDLHAFLLLNELCPGETDIVSAAEHDEIGLGVDAEELAKVITENQVVELVRCGVRYSGDGDFLSMFV